jgi:urea transport system permease protein
VWVMWRGVGGGGTLAGAALGAFFVSGAKNWFTGALPELWLYVLGGLFIVVTLFVPEGIVGLGARLRRARPVAVPTPAPVKTGAA